MVDGVGCLRELATSIFCVIGFLLHFFICSVLCVFAGAEIALLLLLVGSLWMAFSDSYPRLLERISLFMIMTPTRHNPAIWLNSPPAISPELETVLPFTSASPQLPPPRPNIAG